MKHLGFLVLASITLLAAGCGGPDRNALARQTVQTYWDDVRHAKFKDAYGKLTSGQQQVNSLGQYARNMFDFLKGTEGVTAIVGNPKVSGDCAKVPVTLKSPKAPNPKDDLHAYQDLYWQNGGWRISNESGGLTHATTVSCA